MAYGSVNSPGAVGIDLANAKSTAEQALSKATDNENELREVKELAQAAKSKAENHTHNYAGSSSPGGAATTALKCTGNSETATKATNDSAGQPINSTYIKDLSADGLSISYTKGDGNKGKIDLNEGVSAKVRHLSRFSDNFKLI